MNPSLIHLFLETLSEADRKLLAWEPGPEGWREPIPPSSVQRDFITPEGDDRATTVKSLVMPNAHEDLRKPILKFDRGHLQPRAGVRTLFIVLRFDKPRYIESKMRIETWAIGIEGTRVAVHAPGRAIPFAEFVMAQKGPARITGIPRQVAGKWIIAEPEPIEADVELGMRPVYPIAHQTVTAILKDIRSPGSEYLAELMAQEALRRSIAAQWDPFLAGCLSKLIPVVLKRRKLLPLAFEGLPDTSTKSCRERFAQLIRLAHYPKSLEEAQEGLAGLHAIAAVGMLSEPIADDALLLKTRSLVLGASGARTLDRTLFKGGASAAIKRLSAGLPHQITREQSQAIKECLADLLSGRPMTRILCGDVGTGKTSVYSAVVRAAALSGWRVCVLLPSVTLAEQIYGNLCQFNPDLSIRLLTRSQRAGDEAALITVGTLTMAKEYAGLSDLVIVDEQQRFSVAQREALLTECGHLLEVSATCIPRSQALILLNHMQVSRITKSHVQKSITTSIRQMEGIDAAIALVRDSLAERRQVLVVYPAKHKCDYLVSIEDHREHWQRAFGDQVAELHSGIDDESCSATILQLKENRVSVILATVKVEVGLDIPGVDRAIIWDPNGFGLSTLHQIRGRVSRKGGQGYCDLFINANLPPPSIERLEFLANHNDGFEIAHYDLVRRGSGDLGSMGSRQAGKRMPPPFPGMEVPIEALMRASVQLRKLYGIQEAPDLDALLKNPLDLKKRLQEHNALSAELHELAAEAARTAAAHLGD